MIKKSIKNKTLILFQFLNLNINLILLSDLYNKVTISKCWNKSVLIFFLIIKLVLILFEQQFLVKKTIMQLHDPPYSPKPQSYATLSCFLNWKFILRTWKPLKEIKLQIFTIYQKSSFKSALINGKLDGISVLNYENN